MVYIILMVECIFWGVEGGINFDSVESCFSQTQFLRRFLAKSVYLSDYPLHCTLVELVDRLLSCLLAETYTQATKLS